MNRKDLFSNLPTFGAKPDKVSYPKPEKEKAAEKANKRYPIAKVSAKRKAENQGRTQIDVFNEIWEIRPHISELSGKPLPYNKGHKMWFSQFLHVINKGRSSKLKLDPENILLATPKEHERQNTFPKFRERLVYLTKKHFEIKIKEK